MMMCSGMWPHPAADKHFPTHRTTECPTSVFFIHAKLPGDQGSLIRIHLEQKITQSLKSSRYLTSQDKPKTKENLLSHNIDIEVRLWSVICPMSTVLENLGTKHR